ncbi:MAG TPA: hypothetical protein VJZ75_02845, partial [Candidatus Bathyarchaeia archaeon]|nr:hypothetical protein [Candidatus Bathyarchaeia archaeon]
VGKLIGFIPWEKLIYFVLELAAVFLGVLAAFLADNYSKDKAERKERGRILNLIRAEINYNKQILDTLKVGLKESDVPPVVNTHPMRGMWEGFTNRLGLVENDKLRHETTLLYFVLANLDTMIDNYNPYASEYQYADTKKKLEMAPIIRRQHELLVGYLKEHVLPHFDKVLPLFDTELNDA